MPQFHFSKLDLFMSYVCVSGVTFGSALVMALIVESPLTKLGRHLENVIKPRERYVTSALWYCCFAYRNMAYHTISWSGSGSGSNPGCLDLSEHHSLVLPFSLSLLPLLLLLLLLMLVVVVQVMLTLARRQNLARSRNPGTCACSEGEPMCVCVLWAAWPGFGCFNPAVSLSFNTRLTDSYIDDTQESATHLSRSQFDPTCHFHCTASTVFY